MHSQEKNREHALKASQASTSLVIREMRRHQRYLENRMEQLRREARRLIAKDPELERRFRLMAAGPGTAETSALQHRGGPGARGLHRQCQPGCAGGHLVVRKKQICGGGVPLARASRGRASL